jgi:hypothetical protein
MLVMRDVELAVADNVEQSVRNDKIREKVRTDLEREL